MPKKSKQTRKNTNAFVMRLSDEAMARLEEVAELMDLKRTQLIRQMLAEFLGVYASRRAARPQAGG